MIAIASILSKMPNLQINLRGRPFFLGFFFFFHMINVLTAHYFFCFS